MVKNPPANAEDVRDAGWIPGSVISPGGELGSPLQYSCLGNPMDREAWGATVQGVAKSQTQLKRLSMHAQPWYTGGAVPVSCWRNRLRRTIVLPQITSQFMTTKLVFFPSRGHCQFILTNCMNIWRVMLTLSLTSQFSIRFLP